jgi:hypothetical protein
LYYPKTHMSHVPILAGFDPNFSEWLLSQLEQKESMNNCGWSELLRCLICNWFHCAAPASMRLIWGSYKEYTEISFLWPIYLSLNKSTNYYYRSTAFLASLSSLGLNDLNTRKTFQQSVFCWHNCCVSSIFKYILCIEK